MFRRYTGYIAVSKWSSITASELSSERTRLSVRLDDLDVN